MDTPSHSRPPRKSSSVERSKAYGASASRNLVSIGIEEGVDFTYETDTVWSSLLEDGFFHVGDQTAVDLDLILPNGILVPVKCPTTRTLAMLKQDLFTQAKR